MNALGISVFAPTTDEGSFSIPRNAGIEWARRLAPVHHCIRPFILQKSHCNNHSMISSWMRGRNCLIRMFDREGCTRLVKSTTASRRSRSSQKDVPVNPKWPTLLGEKCRPLLEPLGEGVSNPRVQPEPFARVHIVSTQGLANQCDPRGSPQAFDKIRRRVQTPPAVPKSPAWPATPLST